LSIRGEGPQGSRDADWKKRGIKTGKSPPSCRGGKRKEPRCGSKGLKIYFTKKGGGGEDLPGTKGKDLQKSHHGHPTLKKRAPHPSSEKTEIRYPLKKKSIGREGPKDPGFRTKRAGRLFNNKNNEIDNHESAAREFLGPRHGHPSQQRVSNFPV